MTDAKEFLGRAWKLELEMRKLEERRARLLSGAMRGTSGYEATRSGGTPSHSKVEVGVCAYMELEGKINALWDEQIKVKAEIAAAIQRVPNERHRVLLRMRYIEFKGWDTIAGAVGKGRYYVAHELHDNAVKTISCMPIDKYPPRVV